MRDAIPYLQEDLAKDSISLFLEDSREDDSDTISRCLDIDGLLVSIMDGHQISLSATLTFQILLRLECQFEWSSKRMAFEQRDAQNKCITSLCDRCQDTKA